MPDSTPLVQPAARPMRRLLSYLGPMRGRLSVATGYSVANKVLDLAPPLLVAWLIDSVTGNAPRFLPGLGLGEMFPQIVFLAVLTVVIFGVESLTQWGYAYGFMTIAQDMQHRLRVDAYERAQSREIRFFEEHRLGQTLAMLNDDVNQLERFLNNAANEIIQILVLVAFAGAVLFGINPPLAALCLAPLPLIVWGSVRFSRVLEPRYRKVRASVGDVASRLENNIGGITVIKSFTAERYEAGRVASASDAYRTANRDAIKLNAVFIPIIRMGIALGFASIMVLGGWFVIGGALTAGELVLFCMMSQRLLWPMTRLGQTFDEYQRAKASARRIFGLLDTPAAVQDPDRPAPIERARGDVEFDDVFFRYRNREPVLDGLSLRVRAGEMIGIAGTTGAGKSTLIKLLLRFYDVDEGAIRIDGVDVRQLRQHDLRRQIALVSQDVFLFHGTIRENIAYPGVDAPIERVIAASRHAQFHDFVRSLPDGYDTIVGERGIRLSGGQRQRLSIARALLKDAPILVLDEATSSVDTETERMIQQNLRELTTGRTALVVAHRLSTIRKADRIVVIRDGRIGEEGAHDELVARGGTYSELWAVQSGGELVRA